MDEQKKDDGGIAFPIPGFTDGMSLRDWFAGMALQGLKVTPYSPSLMAIVAYQLADAMIEARKS